MTGIMVVLKPPGMTSHDVVDWVRHRTGVRKAGHTGTLDPGAAGVLPVCLGKATRITEYLLEDRKRYRGESVLGTATTTGDAAGEVVARADASAVTPSKLMAAMDRFRGTIEQVPPMASALKYRGQPLYRMARQGVEVPRAARQVTIFALKLLAFSPGREARALLEVECSKGTYIRALFRDLGEVLGCGAHLGFLLRTGAGPFTVDDAWTLEEIERAASAGELDGIIKPTLSAVPGLERVVLSPDEARRVADGVWPRREEHTGSACRGRLVALTDAGGNLLAVAEEDREYYRLRKVLV